MLLSAVKVAGLIADSLTLSGSVILAADSLFKRRIVSRRRASIDTAKQFRNAGLSVVQEDGTPIDDRSIEDHETSVTSVLAWVGVSMLITGFAILLVIRIVLP